MKGYSEWTCRSHLIAELLSRQHKWQPERRRDRKQTAGRRWWCRGGNETTQRRTKKKKTKSNLRWSKHPNTRGRSHTHTHNTRAQNNDITVSTKSCAAGPARPLPFYCSPLLAAISLSICLPPLVLHPPFLCLHYFNHSIKSVNTFIIVASGGGCYLAITLFSNCIVTGDDGKRRSLFIWRWVFIGPSHHSVRRCHSALGSPGLPDALHITLRRRRASGGWGKRMGRQRGEWIDSFVRRRAGKI